MSDPYRKPRVVSVLPSRGEVKSEAALSHFMLPTAGRLGVVPGLVNSSLLSYGFNLWLAQALNWQREDFADYLAIHHDDVEIHTPCWLDVMVGELHQSGAAVLSAVLPIKDGSGLTSTAVEAESVWAPRKLTLAEVEALPETFGEADVPGLLVNTGLLLIDLARPEFHRNAAGDELPCYFTIRDRVVMGPEGRYVAQVASEDWNFSRMCRAAGLPVAATRKVHCTHYGWHGYENRTAKGA